MNKYFLDDGVIVVRDDGMKEFLYPVEYIETFGVADGVDVGAVIELRMKYTNLPAPPITEEKQREDTTFYWNSWKKLVMLCAKLCEKRAGNKATGYLPREINDALNELSRANCDLGFWSLDERMAYRLEQDLCSGLQRLYVELVRKYSKSGEVVSIADIYEMAHNAA